MRFSYWLEKYSITFYILLVTTMTFGFLKIAQVPGHLWIHNCSTQLFPEGPKVHMWALKSGHLTKYFLHCQGHNSNILWDLVLLFPFWISFIYILHFCVLKVHHVILACMSPSLTKLPEINKFSTCLGRQKRQKRGMPLSKEAISGHQRKTFL